MGKLMSAYCKKQGISDPKLVRFLFDGARIAENQTPADIGLEDNNSIDVMVNQVGGGR